MTAIQKEHDTGCWILDYGFLEKVHDNAMAIELINYLKATKLEVGLLMNFGKKAEFKERYLHMIENKV